MKSRVRRTSLRKPSTRPIPQGRQSGFDLWLVRGSHIAQFGLFILTLWALFYTVIPLYKTAALEEQIARRETELKVAEQKLAETSEALKAEEEKAYRRSRADVLWRFRFRAGPSCSGLFRPPEEPVLLGEKPREERPLLDINVADCLSAEMARLKPETILRPTDLATLRAEVDRVASLLEQRRSAAVVAMGQMHGKSTEELEAFAPSGPYVRQLGEVWKSLRRDYPGLLLPDSAEVHARALENARQKIAWDFEEQVRVEINKLQDIQWPN